MSTVDLTARLRRARLAGENENKNARDRWALLFFVLSDQPLGRRRRPVRSTTSYVSYVSYVVACFFFIA